VIRAAAANVVAHASCYCTALSHVLGEDAEDGCPISNAFKGNVELSMETTVA